MQNIITPWMEGRSRKRCVKPSKMWLAGFCRLGKLPAQDGAVEAMVAPNLQAEGNGIYYNA